MLRDLTEFDKIPWFLFNELKFFYLTNLGIICFILIFFTRILRLRLSNGTNEKLQMSSLISTFIAARDMAENFKPKV